MFFQVKATKEVVMDLWFLLNREEPPSTVKLTGGVSLFSFVVVVAGTSMLLRVVAAVLGVL